MKKILINIGWIFALAGILFSCEKVNWNTCTKDLGFLLFNRES